MTPRKELRPAFQLRKAQRRSTKKQAAKPIVSHRSVVQQLQKEITSTSAQRMPCDGQFGSSGVPDGALDTRLQPMDIAPVPVGSATSAAQSPQVFNSVIGAGPSGQYSSVFGSGLPPARHPSGSHSVPLSTGAVGHQAQTLQGWAQGKGTSVYTSLSAMPLYSSGMSMTYPPHAISSEQQHNSLYGNMAGPQPPPRDSYNHITTMPSIPGIAGNATTNFVGGPLPSISPTVGSAVAAQQTTSIQPAYSSIPAPSHFGRDVLREVRAVQGVSSVPATGDPREAKIRTRIVRDETPAIQPERRPNPPPSSTPTSPSLSDLPNENRFDKVGVPQQQESPAESTFDFGCLEKELSKIETQVHTGFHCQTKMMTQILHEISTLRDFVHHEKNLGDVSKGKQGPESVATPVYSVERHNGGVRVMERVQMAMAMRCEGHCSVDRENEGRPSEACVIGTLWSVILSRASGASTKSGTIIGLFVSEGLRLNAERRHLPFFPDHAEIYSDVFCPLVKRAAKTSNNYALNAKQALSDEHLRSFFDTNEQKIVAEVRLVFRNTRGTRKKEILSRFNENLTAADIKEGFGTPGCVDSGVYRCHGGCPVDGERFLAAVKFAFRAKNTSSCLSLSQLAFTSISLVREYVSKRVNPMLFQIVHGAGELRVELEEQKEAHGLMCASLASQLDATDTAVLNGTGWKTTKVEIVCDFNADLLTAYKEKLGARLV